MGFIIGLYGILAIIFGFYWYEYHREQGLRIAVIMGLLWIVFVIKHFKIKLDEAFNDDT